MPLQPGSSERVIKDNIAELVKAGRKPAQAAAIAYKQAGKAKDAMHYYTTARLSENISLTPEGYMLCIGAPIARVGELNYVAGELLDDEGNEVVDPLNGQIRITRGAEDLFNPVSMASFEGKAITVSHPSDFVCPLTWNEVSVGHMQNIRPGTGDDADKLLADLMITDADAISLVQAGLRELSLGYDAEYEKVEPGVGRQSNIVGNHVALVRKGRNGTEVAVRDSAPETIPGSMKMSLKLREAMKKLIGRAVDEMPDDALENTDKPAPSADAPGDTETRMANIEEGIAKLMAMLEGNAPAADVVPPAAEEDATGQRLAKIEEALASLIDKCAGAMDVKPATTDAKATDAAAATIDADTKSRVEIVAPGTAESPTMVKDAITAFGKTTDGAAALTALAGIKDENALLTALSEVVKAKRDAVLAAPTVDNMFGLKPGPMTAEKINEMNEQRYGKTQA